MESITKAVAPEKAEGKIISLDSLKSYLERLKDSRKPRGKRYDLPTILILIIFAKLCGQDKPSGIADWAQQRSDYLVEVLNVKKKRMPHHSTYRRILQDEIDEDDFEQTLQAYWDQQPKNKQSVVIVIDGKTVRGTITAEDPFGLHLLAAYMPGEGIVLMQMVVEKEKENEIVVAPKLLKCLDLRNKVVTGDAMHTQRNLSVQIVEAGGEYVWIVKDNQANTRKAIELLFAPETAIPGLGCPEMDFHSEETFDKKHGRLEYRSITVSSLLNEYLDWPYLAQVFKLERRFTYIATGKVHHEVQYGMTSLTKQEAPPKRLLAIVREEWGIENGLHYRRDVTFHEDNTRMSHKSMARIMAAINNLVIGLLHQQGFNNFARARRTFDANPARAIALIL